MDSIGFQRAQMKAVDRRQAKWRNKVITIDVTSEEKADKEADCSVQSMGFQRAQMKAVDRRQANGTNKVEEMSNRR